MLEFDGDPNLQNWVRNVGPLPQRYLVAQNIKLEPNFGQHRNLIANISGMKKDVVKQKTAFQTIISSAHVLLGLIS